MLSLFQVGCERLLTISTSKLNGDTLDSKHVRVPTNYIETHWTVSMEEYIQIKLRKIGQ